MKLLKLFCLNTLDQASYVIRLCLQFSYTQAQEKIKSRSSVFFTVHQIGKMSGDVLLLGNSCPQDLKVCCKTNFLELFNWLFDCWLHSDCYLVVKSIGSFNESGGLLSITFASQTLWTLRGQECFWKTEELSCLKSFLSQLKRPFLAHTPYFALKRHGRWNFLNVNAFDDIILFSAKIHATKHQKTHFC